MRRVVSTADASVECATCREVNKQGTVACARCGQILLWDDQTRERRAQIEQWKREVERESVDYPTMTNLILDRFSGHPHNKGKYFGSISNDRKRIRLLGRFVTVLTVAPWAVAAGH